MSYEGYEEWRCVCGKVDSADAHSEQPKQCECGKHFVAHRGVDCTNGIDTGDWVDVEYRLQFDDYVRKGYSMSSSPSFCDSVLGEPKPDVKTAIADEAKRIVSGARRSAYGKPEQNFERISAFWTAYMRNTGRDIELTAADVAPMMRLMKEARLCETPDHRDSFVDLVGYALCGAELNGVAA